MRGKGSKQFFRYLGELWWRGESHPILFEDRSRDHMTLPKKVETGCKRKTEWALDGPGRELHVFGVKSPKSAFPYLRRPKVS